MIISASRRTDIPAFYSEWFMNRLKEGYVLTKNPMNPSQISRISLAPEDIDCIVFWTKDPVRMMEKLPQLDAMGYHYYFQFTLTPYNRTIEHNLRDKKEIIGCFRQLSDQIGPDRVLWRYDPIILNHELTPEYHIRSFRKLCEELQGYSRLCTISFVDIYNKLSRQAKEQIVREITEEEIHSLAIILAELGVAYGFELRACCEKLDLSGGGIRPASCIDREQVERIIGHNIKAQKDKSQRQDCGCFKSVDIGVYNTCLNGCVYCYANHSEASIRRNYLLHNPEAPILTGTVSPDARIRDRI